MQHTSLVIATIGPITIQIWGASTTAISATTIIVGIGAAIALILAGLGVYHWLRLLATNDDCATTAHRFDGEQAACGRGA